MSQGLPPLHGAGLQCTSYDSCSVCIGYLLNKKGFSKMHVEEWHDPSQNAAWQRQDHRPGPWPFKPGGSPFFLYPGGSNPTRAIIDIAHTFHIKGVGCDFVASALALCARKGLFGQGTFDYKLQVAYYIYMQYCTATKKTTSIRQWSNIGDLGMTSQKDFPTTVSGKGFDTGIVCGFLEAFLAEQDCAYHFHPFDPNT